MKTNRTIFTLLLLGFFSMLFSCDTDYLYNTEIRIENASQHDVEIIVEKPSSEAAQLSQQSTVSMVDMVYRIQLMHRLNSTMEPQ